MRALLVAHCFLFALTASARAADISVGYAQGQGGYYSLTDRSGPYAIGPNGIPILIAGAVIGGSQEQDVVESRTLNATSTASQQTYTLNGQATFSFAFTGLAASGATVSFFQSNDWNGTTGTFTPVGEVNTGNGVASLTRAVDGQSAIGVEGTKAVRVQVTTAGTGTITLATNISVRSRYVALRSPVPAGTNVMGFVALRSPGTNRSATITTTASTPMAANPSRQGWKIKNDCAVSVWISFDSTATPTPGSGNMQVLAGGYLANEPEYVETGAMSVVTGSGTCALTIREH